MQYHPLNRQQLIHLFDQRQAYYAKGEGVMAPKLFFRKWIPIKYNIPVGSNLLHPFECPFRGGMYLTYRQACIQELLVYFPHLQAYSIESNWGKEFEKCPSYLPPFLFLLDLVYDVQLGLSPTQVVCQHSLGT